MLNTTYKIIAKILAKRLKRILPSLISRKQTGFIPGRHILENISIAWLTIDWIQRHKTQALFLKLDFEKAFNRVDHSYVWETMHLLGIGNHFIWLVKALLTPASSVVQVNGFITKSIGLRWGVRQGCPISPLLFVISTQPLMDFMESELKANRLSGLQVSHTFCILHRLFADDLGVFIPASETAFEAIKNVLHCYEKASGARLNLLKSVIIPFNLDYIPPWLQESGCIISLSGEIERYLGAPIGLNLHSDHSAT